MIYPHIRMCNTDTIQTDLQVVIILKLNVLSTQFICDEKTSLTLANESNDAND